MDQDLLEIAWAIGGWFYGGDPLSAVLALVAVLTINAMNGQRGDETARHQS